MKPKFYYNDTWRQGFLFFIGHTVQQMEKYIYKKYGVSPEGVPPEAGGMTRELIEPSTGKSVIIIWLPEKKFNSDNIASLGHECLHAANRTCYNRGFALDAENDEAHAYLFTIIFEKALELMK